MTKKILTKLLCLCLAACMLTSAATYIYAADEADIFDGETKQIVRLKVDIPEGDRISKDDVELVTVKNVNIPDNVFTDVDTVVTNYALEHLYAGDYLYKSQIADKPNTSAKKDVIMQNIKKSSNKFLVVSDYIMPNTGEDVTPHLQSLISQNPGRTIYFPDGEYIISSSLYTQSEGPKSTTFYFSSNAVLKASEHWTSKDGRDALICLGTIQKDGTHVNDNRGNGSYFGVFGGIFDGNNKADGIAIVSSRESIIYGCTIKNALIGVDIKNGANNKSADADIENVTIIGNGKLMSIGINVIGYDNTFTNIRIYDMEKGFHIESGGNALRSIEVYNTKQNAPNYMRTIGFEQTRSTSFFYDCYVENCATAYFLQGGQNYVMDSLNAKWTYAAPQQKVFKIAQDFNTRISHCRVDFYDATTNNILIESGNGAGARARIDTPIFNSEYENNGYYKNFITKNGIVDLAKS